MNDAELVVAGLLNEGAEYAYEVEQHIRERRLREWAAVGFSSVYYLLHRAEEAGWVRSRPGPGRRGPRTRRYQLTAQGRKELRAAVRDRLRPSAVPTSVELAMMFAGVVKLEALRKALVDYGRQSREMAQEARGRWEHMPDAHYRAYRDAIFDHAICLLEAQADWAERAVLRLQPPVR